jgi:hypothetical protein
MHNDPRNLLNMATMEPKIRAILLLVISVVAFFCGFNLNLWRVAEPVRFQTYDRQSESFTMGRLVKSRSDGIFSGAGLTGRCDCEGTLKDKIDYQFRAYEEDLECGKYHPYLSQIGFHAIFYSAVDAISPFSSPVTLKLLRGIKSLLLALSMGFIMLWFYYELGFGAALAVSLTILLTPWFTLMGKDLWFCIWTNYFPFLLLLFLLRNESKSGTPSEKSILLWGSFAILFSFIFNGYEWVTTSLIMAAVPFFFYWRKDRWPFKKLVRRVAWLAAGSIASLLLTFSFLAYQVSIVRGKFSDGVDWITYSFNKRAYGGANVEDVYLEQTSHSVWQVFLRYLSGSSFELPTFIARHLPWLFNRVFFAELIFVFILLTILFFYPGKILKVKAAQLKHLQNLAIVTWISILAPLSWYVVFKGHAWSHSPINFITMFMPFCLFGMAMIGKVIQSFTESRKTYTSL